MAKKQIATFLGTQKGFTVVGNRHYATSGSTAFSGETTLIEAVTGRYYTKSFVQYGMDSATSGDVTTRVYLNGIVVMGHETNDSATLDRRDALKLIIPPNTTLKITMQLSTGSSTGFCIVTGRIYDA